jgi:uncharacterized membrane protein
MNWRLAGMALFAALFVASGIDHFVVTGAYLKIMPPYLPFPRVLVLLSGAFELALGVMLLIPRTSRLAAWGLVTLLVAVFPANIYLYQHQEILPLPPIAHLLRLPLQGLLILWAYTYTRKSPVRHESDRGLGDRFS